MTQNEQTGYALNYVAVLVSGAFGTIVTFANVNNLLGTASGILTVFILGNKVRRILKSKPTK